MMRAFLLTVVVWGGLVVPSAAEPFRLFGVTFGMTKAEVEKIWKPMDSGEYYIKESVLFAVRPEFDARDRLYRVTFSVPLPETYPPAVVGTAFQSLVTRLWQEPTQTVNTRLGKGSAETTVTSQKLEREYMEEVQAELRALFLKP